MKYSMGLLLQDFSKGTRLEELNMLLTQTVMVCFCSLDAYATLLFL